MPVTIGSNISSLKAQRLLADASSQRFTAFERLSSGQRINRAADDAAGLSVSDTLRADRRVFNQGVRNLNDGLSLLAIADSAIESLSNIAVRLSELAEQSANGAYSVAQRRALDGEAQALAKEYSRIAQTTKFNNLRLLNGSSPNVGLQAGYGTDGMILAGVGGAIGTGTFGAATTYTQGANGALHVELGDLNGDGFQDMVSAGGALLNIRLGNGDGTFGASVTYSGSNSEGLVLTDMNGDGILDVATVGATGINIRIGTGTGHFGAATSYGSGYTDLAAGDMNGDGKTDIAAVESAGVVLYLGTGNGTLGAGTAYSIPPYGAYFVKTGDLNGDGLTDVVTSTAYSGAGLGTANVRLGRADGTLGAAVSYSIPSAEFSAVHALGDFNGDGRLDLAATGDAYSELYIRLGAGDGTFGSVATYSTGSVVNTSAMKTADVNGDGALDILTAGVGAGGVVQVLFNNGAGTFTAGATYSGGNFGLAADDLNGDGVADIAFSNSVLDRTMVRLGNAVSGANSLLAFDLTTIAGARQALSKFTDKIRQLSAQRGTIGSFQARANVAMNVLMSTAENYAAAESRIRDSDIAEESSNLLRLNILQQASAGVLAQANLQPNIALTLLAK